MIEHSKKYKKVKKYYDMGLWSAQRVKNSAVKGWIYWEEYEEIIGNTRDLMR